MGYSTPFLARLLGSAALDVVAVAFGRQLVERAVRRAARSFIREVAQDERAGATAFRALWRLHR